MLVPSGPAAHPGTTQQHNRADIGTTSGRHRDDRDDRDDKEGTAWPRDRGRKP
ncbi:hypothetical protein STRIP9103_03290 [Streptomyces ipomoeae 91-03]|uniref:Uncharacterized protein n=1 Tax=Streptomyces ipomoeae 91-03 TaxID=698759 RepID=L1KYL1_9ACTN|nr:hypothetical protein STRIP9103_03290 [Streptomyces ipomoeae 91-03]